MLRREENFDPVFPGVTGSGDPKWRRAEIKRRDPVPRRQFLPFAKECPKKFADPRTLNGEPGVLIALIFELHAVRCSRGR